MIRVDRLPIRPVKVVLKLIWDALSNWDLTERGSRVCMEIVVLLVEVDFGCWWVGLGGERILSFVVTLAVVA